jgi:hypothetical protein
MKGYTECSLPVCFLILLFIFPFILPDRTGHHYVFRAHGFRMADVESDFVWLNIGKMKGADEDTGFYFIGNFFALITSLRVEDSP